MHLYRYLENNFINIVKKIYKNYLPRYFIYQLFYNNIYVCNNHIYNFIIVGHLEQILFCDLRINTKLIVLLMCELTNVHKINKLFVLQPYMVRKRNIFASSELLCAGIEI